MKSKELSDLSIEELTAKLQELKKDIIKQNAQVALGANAKSSNTIKKVKKDIARILTILKTQGGDKTNKK